MRSVVALYFAFYSARLCSSRCLFAFSPCSSCKGCGCVRRRRCLFPSSRSMAHSSPLVRSSSLFVSSYSALVWYRSKGAKREVGQAQHRVKGNKRHLLRDVCLKSSSDNGCRPPPSPPLPLFPSSPLLFCFLLLCTFCTNARTQPEACLIAAAVLCILPSSRR